MTCWESVEFELGRLYTWFGGKLDDQQLMSEYGGGTIFKARADALDRKADRYFQKFPNQKREGQFSELLTIARGFSNRRNDIAHSIAFRIDRITYFRERIKPNLLDRQHFALLPPLYADRWASAKGFPVFAYTSVEMERIARRLVGVADDIVRFQGRVPGK